MLSFAARAMIAAASLLPQPSQAQAACPEPAQGASDFSVEEPRSGAGPALSAADFGLSPSAKDNSAFLGAALDAVRKRRAARLLLPAGRYRFSGRKPLPFSDLKDLSIDAQGAVFEFYGHNDHGGLIAISRSARLSISGLGVDWDWERAPLALAGKIISSDGGRLMVEFSGPGRLPAKPKLNNVEMVDPGTFAPSVGGTEVWNPPIGGLRKTGARTLMIGTGGPLAQFKAGQTIRARQYMYECHAFVLDDSSHVSLKQVQVYAAPGMAFVVRGDSHHIHWLECKVAPPVGGGRCLSAATDGIHIAHSQGWLKVEGCEFRLQGDDAINIKDDVSWGLVQPDSMTLVLKNVWDWRNRFHPGDVLEFRKPDYSPSGLSPKISKVEWLGKRECRLRFASGLPVLDPASMVWNLRYHTANYIIRNNSFRENRARGLLLKAPKGLVEGNTFYRTGTAAMLFELGRHGGAGDPEGREVSDLVIRHNRILSCNAYRWYGGPVHFEVLGLPGSPAYAPFSRLLFQDNRIEDYPGPAVFLRHARGVVFKDNAFSKVQAPKIEDSSCVSGLGDFLRNR